MMKKLFLLSAFVIFAGLFRSQNISSGKWSDLFSYNNVLAMKEDGGKIIAATENGIFYYTISTGEITKLSKANGLHEVKISAFDYNPTTKIGIVGYKSGAMDLITPEGINYIIDIPLATGYTGSKKINHISITGNQAVISTGYGVSIFNIDTKGFGDTAFFQTSGIFEAVKEAIISNNVVFAATASGIKSHTIDVSFPIYSTWTTQLAGNYSQIDSEGSVMAVSDGTTVKFGNGTSFSNIPQSFSNVKDVVVSSQNIVVSDATKVSLFTVAGAFQKTLDVAESVNTGIFAVTNIFAGTQFSGILDESKKSYKPDGPFTNTSFKINLVKDKILVSTGSRESRYNGPVFDPRNLGFYYYTGTEWVYPSYFKNNSTKFNVLDAVANPTDTNEVFFNNYSVATGQGLYKLKYNATSKDFDFVKYYLTDPSVSYNRPVAFSFDSQNNLFAFFSFFNNGAFGTPGLGLYDRASDSFILRDLKVSSQAVQKPLLLDGMIYMPLPRSPNFLGYDYNNTASNFSDDKSYFLTINNGFPSNSQGTLCVAIDKLGDAWIGTDTGLRVLSNASSSIKDANVKVEPVIITQNGIGEELFRDSPILQIEVDSGNQKWVSIDGGGVFYLNQDGQKTLTHFTKANSPLPTDSVTDIKVDEKTGKVYLVTYDGIVVYQGDVVNVTENFGDVLVYPNPVIYANYKGTVKIRGLAEKTNIRITDAAGNLVHQAIARGGFYEWDLNNQKGVRVASGIYYVLMTNADGTDKATAKIAVVN